MRIPTYVYILNTISKWTGAKGLFSLKRRKRAKSLTGQ